MIVPTITAENPHVYREQIERVQGFAKRIHIDLMDGVFTANKSVMPSQVWWPDGIEADIHVMFQNPHEYIEHFISLKPRAVIIHAESNSDINSVASQLNNAGIQCGVALLAETPVSVIKDNLQNIQQLLVFSGNLGHQGGSSVDLGLLDKIAQAKVVNPSLEIAWDGGVNSDNITDLVNGGVEVVNVGGYIHSHRDSAAAFERLNQKSRS